MPLFLCFNPLPPSAHDDVVYHDDWPTDPQGWGRMTRSPRWHWFAKVQVTEVSFYCSVVSAGLNDRVWNASGQTPEVGQSVHVSSCRWYWTPTPWTSWAWLRRYRTPPGGAGCPLSGFRPEPAAMPWRPSPGGDMNIVSNLILDLNLLFAACYSSLPREGLITHLPQIFL